MILIVSGCDGTSNLPSPSATTSASVTTVIEFAPQSIDEAAAQDGVVMCWAGTLVTRQRPGAFRCVAQDPCFTAPSDLGYVLCPLDPTTASDDIVMRADFSGFREATTSSSSSYPLESSPWFFVTTDGLHCGAHTGAIALTEYGPAPYECTSGVVCRPPKDSSTIWSVDCVDLQTHTNTRHSIETIWF